MHTNYDDQQNCSLDGGGTVAEPTAVDLVMVMRVILRIHFVILIVASVGSAAMYMQPELLEGSGLVPKDQSSLPTIGLVVSAVGVIGGIAIRKTLMNFLRESAFPNSENASGLPSAAAFTKVAIQMLIPHVVVSTISLTPLPYLVWSMKVTDKPVYFGILIGGLVLWHLWNTPTQRRLLRKARASTQH